MAYIALAAVAETDGICWHGCVGRACEGVSKKQSHGIDPYYGKLQWYIGI
jgi:hypothetical protein